MVKCHGMNGNQEWLYDKNVSGLLRRERDRLLGKLLNEIKNFSYIIA